jgi:hypothetical protein
MSNPYAMFEIDPNAENEVGIWAEYPIKGHPNKGFKVRFVHSGDSNIPYRDALRARLKPLNYRIQQEMLSDEEFEQIIQKVFTDKIIKEWKVKNDSGEWVDGMYGENFTVIPFNKENVLAAFVSGPRLFKDIKKQADSFATFKSEEVETDSKN